MATSVAPRTGWEDWGKLVLRLAIGGLLLFHGIAKLKGGISWMAGPLGAFGLPAFIGYGVYIGEIVAPLLLIAGKWTRLAGLVIAFNMFAHALAAGVHGARVVGRHADVGGEANRAGLSGHVVEPPAVAAGEDHRMAGAAGQGDDSGADALAAAGDEKASGGHG